MVPGISSLNLFEPKGVMLVHSRLLSWKGKFNLVIENISHIWIVAKYLSLDLSPGAHEINRGRMKYVNVATGSLCKHL
jgi:hypothetical protein